MKFLKKNSICRKKKKIRKNHKKRRKKISDDYVNKIKKINFPFSGLTASAVNFSSGGSESWLNKMMNKKISPNEAAKESHSRMLSDKEVLYGLHTHNIRPDSIGSYLSN